VACRFWDGPVACKRATSDRIGLMEIRDDSPKYSTDHGRSTGASFHRRLWSQGCENSAFGRFGGPWDAV